MRVTLLLLDVRRYASVVPRVGLWALLLGACSADSIAPPAASRVSVTLPSGRQPILAAGESVQLTAIVRDAGGTAIDTGPVTWASSNPAVLVVTSDGARTARATGMSAGTATVTANWSDYAGVIVVNIAGELPLAPPEQPVAFLYTPGLGLEIIPMPAGTVRSSAQGINDAGQVVGTMSFADSTRAFIWSATEGMRTLGVLGDRSDSSEAIAVNASGVVAGNNYSKGGAHGFRWSPITGMTDLGVLPNSNFSSAIAINGRGDIVGSSGTYYRALPFRWSAARGMEPLPLPPRAERFVPYGINDGGIVVGEVPNPADYGSIESLLLSPTGTFTSIETCVGSFTSCDVGARGINQAGQVGGFGQLGAYRWSQSEGQVPLGRLADAFLFPSAVNDSGAVTGAAYLSMGKGEHAFVWTPGQGLRALGVLPGRRHLIANAINNRGQVVGYAQ